MRIIGDPHNLRPDNWNSAVRIIFVVSLKLASVFQAVKQKRGKTVKLILHVA